MPRSSEHRAYYPPGGYFTANSGGTIGLADIQAGIVSLGDDTLIDVLSLTGGEIDQAEDADITVDGQRANWSGDSFEWYGGVLNNTVNLANVIITGSSTTALIDPGAGLTLGSNLSIVNGAIATMLAGTLTSNKSLEVILDAGGMNLDPGAGNTVTWKPSSPGFDFASPLTIKSGAWLELVTGDYVDSKGSVHVEGGRFALREGTSATFGGTFVMDNGRTELYDGSTLAVNDMVVNDGHLSTMAPELSSDHSATIEVGGLLLIDGGDIVIGDGSSPHSFGTLKVDGDVSWRGGTYRPVVNGDGVSSDLWWITGALGVGLFPILDPGSVDGEGNEAPPQEAGMTWLILRADGGITGEVGANNGPWWQLEPENATPVKKWFIKSK